MAAPAVEFPIKLEVALEYDLITCDEAHRMAASHHHSLEQISQ
ncbi:MAG: hypothetical protein P8Y71_08935 [Pseudolabrys sp.]